jgi:D-3-phosphoglycerate dehydrogenase
MRVLVTHSQEDLGAYFGRALPELRSLAEVVTNPHTRNFTPTELVDAAKGCDVVVSHRGTPFSEHVLAGLSDVMAVCRCAVDISDIDVEAASSHGILVAQADKSFVASTAELALGLLLDLSRGIAESTAEYWQGDEPPQRPGRQLRGQTAGILGFGAIGKYLADLLMALGMDVLVHDPYVEVPMSMSAPFDDVVAQSDVLFPLAQAKPATENLIDAAVLAAMKPGGLLVNVSRGQLLDEDAIADALDSGKLGGLAMDVGRGADQRPSRHLAQRRGVIATPHLGGLTPENADAQAASSVEQVAAILAGEMPPRAVNVDTASRLRSFLASHQ